MKMTALSGALALAFLLAGGCPNPGPTPTPNPPTSPPSTTPPSVTPTPTHTPVTYGTITGTDHVTIKAVDMRGLRVKVLVDGTMEDNSHGTPRIGIRCEVSRQGHWEKVGPQMPLHDDNNKHAIFTCEFDAMMDVDEFRATIENENGGPGKINITATY